MLDPAPSLFSITTCWPRIWLILAPTTRAEMSAVLPAGKPLMRWIGALGYSCAQASPAVQASAAATAMSAIFFMHSSLSGRSQACFRAARQSLRHLRRASRQRDDAGPELHEAAGVDIVFSRERQLAIIADAIEDEGGRQCRAVAQRHRQDAGRDQQPSARIDGEGAEMNGAGLDVLDQRRLAAGLVDGERRDVVLPALEHLP